MRTRPSVVIVGIAVMLIVCIGSVAMLMEPILQGHAIQKRWFLGTLGQLLEKSTSSSAPLRFSSKADFDSWCRSNIPEFDTIRSTVNTTVPIPFVRGIQEPGATTDQVLVFILDKHPKLVKRLWPYDCRSAGYFVGRGATAIVSGYANLGAGERDIQGFMVAADAMWVAAANRNKEAFDRARSSFTPSDVFVGLEPGLGIGNTTLRLSGRQLEALASLLAKDVFGEKPFEPTVKPNK